MKHKDELERFISSFDASSLKQVLAFDGHTKLREACIKYQFIADADPVIAEKLEKVFLQLVS